MVRALFALALAAFACASPATRETAVPEAPAASAGADVARVGAEAVPRRADSTTPRRRPRIGRLGPPFAVNEPVRNTLAARSHESGSAIVSQR